MYERRIEERERGGESEIEHDVTHCTGRHLTVSFPFATGTKLERIDARTRSMQSNRARHKQSKHTSLDQGNRKTTPTPTPTRTRSTQRNKM